MQIPKGGIAFFDSGIGGLTVLSECRKRLPNEIFYYYGDNQHAPYGNLSPKKIKRYVFRVFKRLKRLRVRAAVIACNTATAVCIEDLRRKYSFPIIGAEPAVFPAAKDGGRVLVLATKATCESVRFKELCRQALEYFPRASISVCACEQLADQIEKNIHRAEYDFTPYLPTVSADAVVLGCTHYIYIVGQIERHFGCPVYDGNEGIARRLVSILEKNSAPSKNRDKRPLRGIFDQKMGLLTTKRVQVEECQNLTNKCSRKTPSKCSENGKVGEVFFLGNKRKYNQNIHEQMFVWAKRVRKG